MIMAIFIGFAIFAALGFGLIQSYGPIAYYYYTSFDSGKRQALKITPISRKITANLNPNGRKIEAFGYSILVPWQKISNNTEDESSLILIFSPYCIVSISNPKLNLNLYSDLQNRLGPQDSEHLKNYLEIFSNKFEFSTASFNTIPDGYFAFKPFDEFLPLYCFLLNKALYISFGNEFANRIYAFETKNCKGFQIGDPSLSNRIRLYLFADQDHDLEISIAALKSQQLRQTDIDQIILSFKRET